MSRRTKYILIIIGVLALVAVLFGVWLIMRQNNSNVRLADETRSSALPNSKGAQPVDSSTLTPAPDEQQQVVNLEILARSFAERYGSHSNQSDFENIEDLFPFMTSQLSESFHKYVDNQRVKKDIASVYTATTTKALSAVFVSRADQQAVLRVATQRREIGGNTTGPRVYYQDLELAFVKVGEQWKVDKAEWH